MVTRRDAVSQQLLVHDVDEEVVEEERWRRWKW
jgi:hypothetical protein